MTTKEIFNHQINYIQLGDEGSPLLFVHGVPTSSSQWFEVQQNLSDVYKTFNVDLIGMGRSAKPLEGWDYTFANDAKVLAALLDEWGLDKISLCGDDWGGGIALTFAHNYPERVQRLMVFSPTVYDHWPVPEIEAIGRLADYNDEHWLQHYQEIVVQISSLLRSMVVRPSVFTGLTIREFLEPYRTNDYSHKGGYGQPKLDGLKALAKRAQALDPRWMLDLDMNAISSPCLVGWGEEDIYMDPLGMYLLKDEIGGPVRMQLIPKAGHLAMIDKPLEVTELIDDFMSEWQTAEEAAAA